MIGKPAMHRPIAFAACNLAVAVALGALGAHFLKAELSPESLSSFETGVRYHFYHALALLVLTSLPMAPKRVRGPWLLMAIGMLLFSLSIYGLSLRSLFGQEGGLRFLGPITPLGGVLLIISWTWLGLRALSSADDDKRP